MNICFPFGFLGAANDLSETVWKDPEGERVVIVEGSASFVSRRWWMRGHRSSARWFMSTMRATALVPALAVQHQGGRRHQRPSVFERRLKRQSNKQAAT